LGTDLINPLEFYSETHEKKYDVDDVFKDLYPELVFDNE
jgi:hypothetical protein